MTGLVIIYVWIAPIPSAVIQTQNSPDLSQTFRSLSSVRGSLVVAAAVPVVGLDARPARGVVTE